MADLGMSGPSNLIFTVCTGRCGQASLTEYFNRFGKDCIAEVEPPELIYRDYWPLGGIARSIQRKWIFTHEDLGRGKALLWYDNDEHDKLEKLAGKRLKHISRFRERHYIELSKFFIRSYGDAVYKKRNDIGILKLYRNPLMNARSFYNRGKDFALDGVMPHFKKSCLKLDMARLTKYQLYLWQWVEIELRCQRFLEEHKVERYYEIRTEDLNDPGKITALFDYFGIEKTCEIQPLKPANTNVSRGKPGSGVGEWELKEFHQFLGMIPPETLRRLECLEQYSA